MSMVEPPTLVLDDFLNQVKIQGHEFSLADPGLTLQDLQSQPGAEQALAKFVHRTVTRHGGRIYARPNLFLSALGEEVYGEPIVNSLYSGHAIRPEKNDKVLRSILALGLYVTIQLPQRDAPPEYNPKKVLLLAETLTKLGTRLDTTLREKELQGRTRFLLAKDEPTLRRLLQIGDEVRWAGGLIRAIVKHKLRKVNTVSPNPQIRWALFMARWIGACTGRPQYALLKTLMQAAFDSAGKTTPKWVERLEIEMHSQGKRGKIWFQSVSSSAGPSAD